MALTSSANELSKRAQQLPARKSGRAIAVVAAEQIGQSAARLVAESCVEHIKRANPIDAKTAKVFALLAPCRKRPDLAPEEACKRADDSAADDVLQIPTHASIDNALRC